jgi:hypothetical protein
LALLLLLLLLLQLLRHWQRQSGTHGLWHGVLQQHQ